MAAAHSLMYYNSFFSLVQVYAREMFQHYCFFFSFFPQHPKHTRLLIIETKRETLGVNWFEK